ncbi:MAG: hypothetical protein ACRDRY_01150 [Pseudonocardiaceae bacterium]
MGVNPAIEQLRRLYRFGFTGERLFNQDGQLQLVHYTRHFRGAREVVLVYSERTALAYRTRDMLDLESPLDATENAIEWRLHGDVVTVVNALLSLPTPRPLPDPQFPHKIPAGRRSSRPARGVRREFSRARPAGDQQLRRSRQGAT